MWPESFVPENMTRATCDKTQETVCSVKMNSAFRNRFKYLKVTLLEENKKEETERQRKNAKAGCVKTQSQSGLDQTTIKLDKTPMASEEISSCTQQKDHFIQIPP